MFEQLNNRQRCVVRVQVEMLAPHKGRVFGPCCGSAGRFVQRETSVAQHGGRIGNIAVYEQKSNSTTRRLAMMNLAIRGIEGDIGPEHADTFRRDLHKDLKADYVLANPPFNDSDWPQRRGRAVEVRPASQGERKLRLCSALCFTCRPTAYRAKQ